MVALSQNGYVGIADYGDPRLISNPLVPGTAVRLLGGILAGAAGAELISFAAAFDRTVEHLVQDWGCWGFEPRDIRGSTVLSNHASGTAIDLNATVHPMGNRGTFTTPQILAIRALLESRHGRIRWGGDYAGRVDEMHFELDVIMDGRPFAAIGDPGGVSAILPIPALPEDWLTAMSDEDTAKVISLLTGIDQKLDAGARLDIVATQSHDLLSGILAGVKRLDVPLTEVHDILVSGPPTG